MRSKLAASVKGQTIVLVGLLVALGVLIGLVALAFDGGSALLQRRTMQNGSEAGALAGIGKMLEPGRIAVTCVPGPCHPTYNLRNDEVWAAVNSLVQANRGGAIQNGNLAYATSLEYHYMSGSPVYSGTYAPAPPASDQNPVPDYVDGVRVKATINNPTTFAKAFFSARGSQGIQSVSVSASGAALIYGTCAPEVAAGPALPFTRFRPALEKQLYANANTVGTPFDLWNPQGDLGGNDSTWKNRISLNELSFHPILTATPPITQQLLTAFDTRNGPAATGAGLTLCCTAPWPSTGCSANCADMRGQDPPVSGGQNSQDYRNWIGWQWQGTLSTTTDHGEASMTYYPSNQGTNWGRNGGARRLGDWAEMGQADLNGSLGNTIALAIGASISISGTEGPLSGPPLNYGKAITRTVYVWGDAAPTPADPTNYSSDTAAQTFTTCNGAGCTTAYVWEDVTITGPDNSDKYHAPVNVNRVRFTRSYDGVLYQNKQNCCSSAQAIIVDRPVPGPVPGGSCSNSWTPGGGVYGRQVNP